MNGESASVIITVVVWLLQALTDDYSASLRAAAASLLLEVCRKTPELSEAVMALGAAPALVELLSLEAGKDACLAGLLIAGKTGRYHTSPCFQHE